MDFTREPVIQTVITPREGYRLVVRSSKTAGLEEHFVDAVEVVCFGTATFFRSIERPKPFIVPVSDYEVLEVREPRMVLKTPVESSQRSSDKPRHKAESEKPKPQVERHPEKEEAEVSEDKQKPATTEVRAEARAEQRTDRRRDRRRGFRKRRGREEGQAATDAGQEPKDEQAEALLEGEDAAKVLTTAPMLSTILPPPTTLIRDDLDRLRETYSGAFYDVEKEESESEDFPQETFGFSESDISMKEGGDVEVPQQEPFCEEGALPEDAASAQKSDE